MDVQFNLNLGAARNATIGYPDARYNEDISPGDPPRWRCTQPRR